MKQKKWIHIECVNSLGLNENLEGVFAKQLVYL